MSLTIGIVDYLTHPCRLLLCSFRQIPTFGRDTIRKFRSNVSELKRMAARDFEDLLQVRSHITFLCSITPNGYFSVN
jgi:hypothetical protein